MPTDDFDDEFDDADGRSETNTVRELRKALKSKDKQFNGTEGPVRRHLEVNS